MTNPTKDLTMEQQEFEARISQMIADARYNSIRAFWHPVFVAAAVFGAGAAFAKLFL